MRYFHLTNVQLYSHPFKYRCALWLYGWLAIFDAIVFVATLTLVDSSLSTKWIYCELVRQLDEE